MARAKQYSRDEVNEILQKSEGRKSPVSGEPGHTLSLHVGADGYQVSRRLSNTLLTDDKHPLIMNDKGQISSEADHRHAWKLRNPEMTTKQTKKYYRQNIDNHKSKSGSFLDRPQAINVGRFILNSQEGQAALAQLDGAETRVQWEASLNQLDMLGKDAWKMNYAEHGGGDSDITHLEDFSKAYIVIDRFEPGIHIQTLYPMK